MGWQDGGYVDGDPAKVKQDGDRIDALWGGSGKSDGDGHGHIVSHDGTNAAYVREPGDPEAIVDDLRHNPYGN